MTTVVAKRAKNGSVSTDINEYFPSNSLNLIHKQANQQSGISAYYNNVLLKRLPMKIIVSNTVYREKTPAFKLTPNINLQDIDLSGFDHIFNKDCRPKAEIVAEIRNSLKTNRRKVNTKSVQEKRSNNHLSHVSRGKSYKAETLIRHLEFKENDNPAEFDADLDEHETISSSAYEYTSLKLKGQREEISYNKDYVEEETVVESNGLEVINICRYNETLEYITKSMIWKKQKITANLNRK